MKRGHKNKGAFSDSSPSAASRATEQIRNAIVEGALQLGEALSEETLALAFGISRTPVHEALALLRLQGLVTVLPRAGTFVFQPTEADMEQLCEYRLMLELHAASFSFERNRAAASAGMKAANLDMKKALQQNDGRSYGRADTDFHETFFIHCDNHYLRTAYKMSLGRVAALRTHLNIVTPGAMAQSFAEHENMVEIFESGKLADLRKILSAHILRSNKAYLSAFKSGLAQQAESKAERIKRKITRVSPP